MKYKIINTLPTFLTFWEEAQQKPLDVQIEGWASEYMSQRPELLEKQQEDYVSQDVDWRQIAREKVFPFLGDRLPAMQVAHRNDDWLDWCQDHKGWLAAQFLEAVDAGESVRPFFGSWYDIRRRKQCGYFLGHELIKDLEASLSLKKIALLDDFEERFRRMLEKMAG